MGNQIIQPFGLSRIGGRLGGTPPAALEVFDIDEGAIDAWNITDGNAATTYTATDIGGESTQIAQSSGSRVYVYDIGLALGAEDIHIRHTADITAASTVDVGIAINDAGTRTYFQFFSNGRFYASGQVTPSGLIAEPIGPVASNRVMVADYYFRPSENRVIVNVAFDGEAPYSFGFTGIVVGDVELLQHYSSTVIHKIETRNPSLPASLAIDPSVMHSALGYTERSVPTGFTATIPGGFKFYEDSGAYYTSVNLSPPLAETDAEAILLHVDLATGDDTNPGTAASPLKSLHVAAGRFKGGGRGIIKAKGALYPYANCFRNYLGGAAVQIVSWDGEDVISSMHDDALSWALDTGTTYVATLDPGAVNTVFDASNPTSDGDHGALEVAADLATCQATAGTWYQSGTSVYVNLFDGRAPDSDLRVYVASVGGTTDVYGLRQAEDGSVLYMEDVHFEGGAFPFFTRAAVKTHTMDTYAKRCSVKYGGSDGVAIRSDGLQIWQDCVAAWNGDDGFNYKTSPFATAGYAAPLVIEIGCEGRWNGRDTGATNNASTQHGGPIVRVNANHHDNQDRTLHDIDSNSVQTQSWNLGCTASDPQTSDANFSAGIVGGSDTALIWLDGCTSSGGAVDIEANASATVHYDGFTGDAVNNTNDSGTITTYTP